MSPANKYFLVHWARSVIFATLICALMNYIGRGEPDWLMSVCFAIFLSFALGIVKLETLLSNMQNLGITEPTYEQFGYDQSLTMASSVHLASVQSLLTEYEGFNKLRLKDATERRLVYHEGYGYFRGSIAYGQKITIERLSDESLSVRSQPRFWMPFSDAGKNLNNVYVIRQLILRQENAPVNGMSTEAS